jgi:hypothetical protein
VKDKKVRAIEKRNMDRMNEKKKKSNRNKERERLKEIRNKARKKENRLCTILAIAKNPPLKLRMCQITTMASGNVAINSNGDLVC